MLVESIKAQVLSLPRVMAMVLVVVSLGCSSVFAENVADSASAAGSSAEEPALVDSYENVLPDTSSNLFLRFFNDVFQPALNLLVWPISTPINYAFRNGVVETAQDLVTFGPRRNILIYPVFNFKPGNTTMFGFSYRHRNALFNHDYFFVGPEYYANSDVRVSTRYTKQGILGFPLFLGMKYTMSFDRDEAFILPCSRISFVQPDTSMVGGFQFGFPITKSRNLNFQVSFNVEHYKAGVPDASSDSIYINDDFSIANRGLYQEHNQYPLGVLFLYDNLDYAFAPSRGNRFFIGADYYFVDKYKGVKYKDLGLKPEKGKVKLEDAGLNHDFIKASLILQHYFYLGRSDAYILSEQESRVARKFYTDFSWDEALRVWRPENVRTTLFERRVIALQYRFSGMWEREKGGAPYNAFPTLNTRYPFRGYGSALAAPFLMGISMEYRWPVDYYVDGVIFDEYAIYSDRIDHWSVDHFMNSWGFGVRVRKPNMYLFRLQFGFHGIRGVNLVLTIAPEFK